MKAASVSISCSLSLLLLVTAMTALTSGTVLAADAASDDLQEAWTPPAPPADDFDWIQLNSGEWLKGEFKVLYDDTVEFDSDELGLLSLDWGDIRQLRGHSIHSVHAEGKTDVVGNLQMNGDQLVVAAESGTLEIDRKDIISIAHGAPKESNYWSAKFSLGLNISEGNSDRRDLNLSLNTMRRTAASRFIADYLGYYSESQGTKTDDNHRLRSTYDIFKTRRFFWRPALAEYFRDTFQNIDHQVTIGAGAGYQIIDDGTTEWSVAGGPAFKYTKFVNVEPGEADSETTPALWLGTDYNRELNSKMDLILGYSTIYGNQQSGGYTHHAIATLETELLSWLDFDTSFIWDYVQSPTADSDGIVPENNDYRFVIGLGLDY